MFVAQLTAKSTNIKILYGSLNFEFIKGKKRSFRCMRSINSHTNEIIIAKVKGIHNML